MIPLTVYWSSDFLAHEVSPGHPESSQRLLAIEQKLVETGQWDTLHRVDPRSATWEEIGLIHPLEYIRRVEQSSQRGPTFIDSFDTEVSAGSFQAALKTAGAGFQAVDEVIAGRTQTAFIAGRPPGHHALPSTAMGFCLFANVSLAAMYAGRKYNVGRVAIIDWDVHHGNGTQAIFYDSDRAFYLSIHEYPLYPGTGSIDETGAAAGRGFTCNFPLSSGTDDARYFEILSGRIADILMNYRPELIFISAGFDAHRNDPLAHMNISTEGFGQLTSIAVRLAGELSQGRVISFLEGGYDLQGLADSVALHLEIMAGGEASAARSKTRK